MQILIYITITILFICLIIGMWRIHQGPGAVDRILVAQLLGTTGVAILLLNTVISSSMLSVDTALVFALLSAIAAIAFLQSHTTQQNEHNDTD